MKTKSYILDDQLNPFLRVSQSFKTSFHSQKTSRTDKQSFSNWEYEQSTEDEIIMDQLFLTSKNDIKPIFTKQKFELLTHDLAKNHYKNSIHKEYTESISITPNIEELPSKIQKNPEEKHHVLKSLKVYQPIINSQSQFIVLKKSLSTILSEIRLDQYQEKFIHSSSRFLEDLYTIPGKEIESYLKNHFAFLKIGHIRRIAMKFLRDRGEFKPQGIFKSSNPSGDGKEINENECGVRFISLEDWLSHLKLDHCLQNFINSGYDDYEYNVMMMLNEFFVVNDMVLKNDFGITNYEDRRAILINLYKDRERAINTDLSSIPSDAEYVFRQEYQSGLTACKCTIF